MLEEPEAEPLPLVRPFDDARDVGHDVRAVPGESDHAQVRLERGEGIVGDLGSRRRDDREQRALAGVGLAHQAHVGDELEHQLDLPLFALFARLPLAGSLVSRGGKAGIAAPAASASGHQQACLPPEDLTQSSPVAASRITVPGGTGR